MKDLTKWKQLFDSEDFAKQYHYEGGDLGACYQKERTVFKVWAPTATSVMVNLYATGSDVEEGAGFLRQFPMKRIDKGVYLAAAEGDCEGIYYTYLITVDGTERECGDIYAKACGVNGDRSMVVDLEKTNPQGWEQDTHIVCPLEDTQIWEVHIGDFSNDPASGVKEEYRGKYMAFTEKQTTVEDKGKDPTCLSYLKSLGISHIHLLPSFDFGSVEEDQEDGGFNWGYDPVNYNVPEGSYATNPYDGRVRIREYKEMVQALHKAGISVVMDVVYNHTHSLDSHFNHTVPYYYYRQWPDGRMSDGSDCGNDTASDRQMYRKYMIDSVLYWVREYHIDGFRFDLMGLHDVETMNAIRKAVDDCHDLGKHLLIYGEPWSAGETAVREGFVLSDKKAVLDLDQRILLFNDDTRDWVKGSYIKLDQGGFVNGKPGLEDFSKRAFCGKFAKEFTNQPDSPARVIQYVSAHDNSTLWDKLVDTVYKDHDYDTIHEDLMERNKLAAAIVRFSKGIPFMQAGEEAGRTKLGFDNSFNLPKNINWLDWRRMHRFSRLTDYYKGLWEVRKSLPAIKDLSEQSAAAIEFIPHLPKQIVGYYLADRTILVIFNASMDSVEFPIEGTFQIKVNKEKAKIQGIGIVKDWYHVKPISANVLKRV